MNVPAPTLNAALRAYVSTIPMRANLLKHIEVQGLENESKDIQDALNALFKTAEDHLYNYPTRVPQTKEFQQEFSQFLLSKHPWLDEEALSRMIGFAGWLCWHEGL